MKILSKINPIIIIILTFIIIFITQFIFFAFKDNTKIEDLNSQIESYRQNELVFENNIRLLTEKANEVRFMLSLPEINLSQSDIKNESAVSQEINENLPFYNAVDYIQNYSSKVRMENELHSILNSSSLTNYFNNQSIEIQKTGPTSYEILKYKKLYFSIKAENYDNPNIYIQGFTGNKNNFSFKNIVSNNKELLDYFDTEIS
ncbi:MAG: hypothetical protein PF693_07215, partial [Spirochaetia bacterium]|nr:hypothetical protein [Spirochaetia bacterium]